MRKPHVFISSRFKLGAARQSVKSLLESFGFSAEVYEKDSTPSSEPATYMRDVVEADFVIFILDKTYGELRKASGISGLHEEWNRVRQHGIPNHVYLKRQGGQGPERKQKQFIKAELIEREVSYYYYTSVKELLAQIQRSIVKLVFDISLSSRYRSRRDLPVLLGDVVGYDHDKFCQWDRALTIACEYEDQISPGYVTDVWAHVVDLFVNFNPERIGPFIDCRAQELFGELLVLIQRLSHHISRHTVPPGNQGATIPIPDAPLEVTVVAPQRPYPSDYFERCAALKKDVLVKWCEIRRFIGTRYTQYRK